MRKIIILIFPFLLHVSCDMGSNSGNETPNEVTDFIEGTWKMNTYFYGFHTLITTKDSFEFFNDDVHHKGTITTINSNTIILNTTEVILEDGSIEDPSVFLSKNPSLSLYVYENDKLDWTLDDLKLTLKHVPGSLEEEYWLQESSTEYIGDWINMLDQNHQVIRSFSENEYLYKKTIHDVFNLSDKGTLEVIDNHTIKLTETHSIDESGIETETLQDPWENTYSWAIIDQQLYLSYTTPNSSFIQMNTLEKYSGQNTTAYIGSWASDSPIEIDGKSYNLTLTVGYDNYTIERKLVGADSIVYTEKGSIYTHSIKYFTTVSTHVKQDGEADFTQLGYYDKQTNELYWSVNNGKLTITKISEDMNSQDWGTWSPVN